METRISDLEASLKKETEIRDNLQTSTDFVIKKLQEAKENEIVNLTKALEAERKAKAVILCDSRNLRKA